MLPTQPNQSVQNGLACLEAITNANGPIGSRELARQLNLGHATVSRLLNTLAALRYLSKTPNRKFIPGPGLHVLTSQSLYKSQLLRAAVPTLRRLCSLRRYRVALGTVWNEWVVYMFFEDPDEDFEAGLLGHAPIPAINSSIGRALMAHPDSPMRPIGSATFSRREIQAIRSKGYAFVINQPYNLSLGRVIGSPPTAGIALSVSLASGISEEELAEQTAIAVEAIKIALEAPMVPVETIFTRRPL